MCGIIRLLYFVGFLLVVSQTVSPAFARQAGRDPFVPLVDRKGNIRRGQDLFMPTQDILPKIVLKGILWDDNNPLAVINGKVLTEGSRIPLSDGGFVKIIILKKINPDSVILNYNDREFTLKLRKEKKNNK